jgi:hypothetical protein
MWWINYFSLQISWHSCILMAFWVIQ